MYRWVGKWCTYPIPAVTVCLLRADGWYHNYMKADTITWGNCKLAPGSYNDNIKWSHRQPCRKNGWFTARSHTRMVVRECCKDDDQSQWERPKFDPPPPLNPLTDRHQNLPTWLRRGYLPSCKTSSRSDKGFCFCACAISRIKLFTRLFVCFLGGFFISSTAKTPVRILT